MAIQRTIEPIDCLIRPRDAAAMLGVSLATVWRWVKTGKLPPMVKLSDRVVGWKYSDLGAHMTKAQQVNANVAVDDRFARMAAIRKARKISATAAA